jgi:hypothetical protein
MRWAEGRFGTRTPYRTRCLVWVLLYCGVHRFGVWRPCYECQSPACARTPVARQVPVGWPAERPENGKSADDERPRDQRPRTGRRGQAAGARRSWSAPSRVVIEPYSLLCLWSYVIASPVLRPVLAAAVRWLRDLLSRDLGKMRNDLDTHTSGHGAPFIVIPCMV